MAKYSKSYYEQVASILYECQKDNGDYATLVQVRARFITLFEEDSPRFNQDKFLSACKGE